jgi:hypothetical protein
MHPDDPRRPEVQSWVDARAPGAERIQQGINDYEQQNAGFGDALREAARQRREAAQAQQQQQVQDVGAAHQAESGVVQPGQIDPSFPFFKIANRIITMVNIGGRMVPFYISTGAGGKKNVKAGKWYPFFGFGPDDGWMNKGDQNQINDYYGNPELRAAAEHLDAAVGDLQKRTDIPVAYSFAKHPDWGDRFPGAINTDGLFDHLANVNNGEADTAARIGEFIRQLAPAAPAEAAPVTGRAPSLADLVGREQAGLTPDVGKAPQAAPPAGDVALEGQPEPGKKNRFKRRRHAEPAGETVSFARCPSACASRPTSSGKMRAKHTLEATAVEAVEAPKEPGYIMSGKEHAKLLREEHPELAGIENDDALFAKVKTDSPELLGKTNTDRLTFKFLRSIGATVPEARQGKSKEDVGKERSRKHLLGMLADARKGKQQVTVRLAKGLRQLGVVTSISKDGVVAFGKKPGAKEVGPHLPTHLDVDELFDQYVVDIEGVLQEENLPPIKPLKRERTVERMRAHFAAGGKSIKLVSFGFTPEEIASLQERGLVRKGSMSAAEFERWQTAERGVQTEELGYHKPKPEPVPEKMPGYKARRFKRKGATPEQREETALEERQQASVEAKPVSAQAGRSGARLAIPAAHIARARRAGHGRHCHQEPGGEPVEEMHEPKGKSVPAFARAKKGRKTASRNLDA